MTDWVTQLVQDMGYVGLALLTLLENIFPPIPSEVIMPLGGYLVAQGEFLLPWVVLAGTIGSVLGAIVLYWVGRYFTQERLEQWVERHGGWLLLTKEDVGQAYSWFNDHGSAAVFICRLVPGVRSLISIPAGACGMSMGPFLLYTALGTALWSAILAYGGWILGEQYQDLGQVLQWATYAVVAFIVGSIIWWFYQKRQERSPES